MSKRKFGSSFPSLYPVQSEDAFVSPEGNKRSKAMGAQTHPRVSLLPQKPGQHSSYMILSQAPEGVSIPLAMHDEPSLPYTDGSDESFSTESIEFTSFESEPAGVSFYPPSPDSLPLPPKPCWYTVRPDAQAEIRTDPHSHTAIYSSSPAPRPTQIGRKARRRTEEGIFPLPAPPKGVNGRILVMENLPSTWTPALVTRWGSRHGELNFVLVDHGLRKAVLDYKRSEDSRRAYADKPIFLFDDVFLVYWRPPKIQRGQEKSSKHQETAAHSVPDVTRAPIDPPGVSNVHSETIEPKVSGEIEPLTTPIVSVCEPRLSTLSSVTTDAMAPVLSQELVVSAGPPAPVASPASPSNPHPTITPQIAKTPVPISNLSPSALKAREIRLSQHIAETKLHMARYQAATTPAEKSSILAILRECTRLYEEVEKAELSLASQPSIPPPPLPTHHTRPIRPLPRQRQNPFGIFAGRRFPEMEVCLGPIDVSDSDDEDKDLDEGDRL